MKKNVKTLTRALVLALAVIVFATSLVACSPSDNTGGAKREIRVFNWGDYIDEAVLDLFEEETGIKVVYNTFEQNEDMYTMITNTPGYSFDVVIPSDYMIEKMIKEDMLAELDFGNIPNYSLIMDDYNSMNFKKLAFDPEGKFSVPYMWGTVGLIYNTAMVDEEIDSWSALWNEKYSQQLFMMDSQRDSIAVALILLGYSGNSRDAGQLEEAKEKLLAQKDLVLSYTGDDIKDKMVMGEGAMGVCYSGDAVVMIDENPDLAYIVPKEGANVWVDSMCVLKDTKDKEAAEMFINFMCRTDIATMNNDYICYATPQREVFESLDPEIKENPAYYPDEEVMAKCSVFTDPGDALALYNRIWTQVVGG